MGFFNLSVLEFFRVEFSLPRFGPQRILIRAERQRNSSRAENNVLLVPKVFFSNILDLKDAQENSSSFDLSKSSKFQSIF